MKKCYKCLKDFESDFAFCPQCGGPLTDCQAVPENEEATKECPNCKTMNDVKYVFCQNCGASLRLLPKGGRKFPVIPIAVAVGVIIGLAVLVIYFQLPVKNPPSQNLIQKSLPVTAATPGIGPQAVWSPPGGEGAWKDIHEKCQMRTGGYDMACITSMMQKKGASTEAVNFTKMMKSSQKGDADAVYMSQFRKMGRVDLAETISPTWNSPVSPEFILVNGSPEVVQLWDNVRDIDIKKDSLYQTIASRFPKVELWPTTWFNGMQPLPPEGQRFVFDFILMNGCRACDIAGAAEIAFDFDGTGKFLGTKLVRLVDSEAAIASRAASASSGTASAAQSRPSDPVAKGIEEAFARNAINGLNIQKTEEGVYKISGPVKDGQESDRVMWVASSVPGVKRIDRDFNFSDNTAGAVSQMPGPAPNAASVAPAVQPAAPSQSGDPVAGGIEQAFTRNGIKGMNILKTEEGVFKISGPVKDNQEAERVVWVASNVPGVKRVDPDFNLPGSGTNAASQVPGSAPNAAPGAPSAPAAVPTMKDRIEAELALRGFPGVYAWVAGNGSVRISNIDNYPGQTDAILSIASAVSGSADVQVLKLPSPKKKSKQRKRNPDRGRGSIAPPDRDF
ncbi:MAG: BON domain-containing protein [Deltaproteobacteria bacterium]|nr:BON domain-containing protein [Deltaproteobacteria bacterium]